MDILQKRFTWWIALLCAFISLIAVVPGCAEESCKSLLDAKCDSCHYKTRICQRLGKKSKRAWKRTMKNMVRYGVELTPAEMKLLIRCLDEARPGDKRVCD